MWNIICNAKSSWMVSSIKENRLKQTQALYTVASLCGMRFQFVMEDKGRSSTVIDSLR